MYEYFYLVLTSFIALFPVFNPIGSALIVNGLLHNMESHDHKLAIRRIVFNTLLVGVISLLLGHLILLIFGLAIPVVQVGGGLLLCKTGLEWLSSTEKDKIVRKQAIKIKLVDVEEKLFYPITFPIVFDAGVMSVLFTLVANSVNEHDTLLTSIKNYSAIGMVILIMCVILYILFTKGPKLMRLVGSSGTIVINNLLAFFTFCIGLQIILSGIGKIFHITIL